MDSLNVESRFLLPLEQNRSFNSNKFERQHKSQQCNLESRSVYVSGWKNVRAEKSSRPGDPFRDFRDNFYSRTFLRIRYSIMVASGGRMSDRE